jgi:hypothetical protein
LRQNARGAMLKGSRTEKVYQYARKSFCRLECKMTRLIIAAMLLTVAVAPAFAC